MSDLDEAEDSIKEYYQRLEILERKLRFKPMTEDEREQAEKDIIALKKLLKQQEDDIQVIRKGNQGSTLVAVLLIFASFLIYGVYHILKTEYSASEPSTPK